MKRKQKVKFAPLEFVDTGVSKLAIGWPNNEERKELIKNGYTFMSRGETRNEQPPTMYEIWAK